MPDTSATLLPLLWAIGPVPWDALGGLIPILLARTLAVILFAAFSQRRMD